MKQTAKTYEEEEFEIRIGLDEGTDIKGQLDRLYRLTRPGLISFLDRKFSTLSTEDKLSVIHDSFSELGKQIQARKVDLNNPIPPLLLTILDRRGIDLIRKRSSVKEKSTDYYADVYLDTLTEFDWERKRKRGTQEEIREQIRHHIATSSPLSKAVAEGLLSLCPPKPKPDALKEVVDGILGKPTPMSSILSTQSRLRKEFRKLLKE